MSLKILIESQTITIDDHKRGSREIKDWDDRAIDIHIDKKTNFKVDGVYQNIRIRVPINSNRPLKIENGSKKVLEKIPSKLEREIKRAFENKKIRDDFVADVRNVVKNFTTILENEERVKLILANISKHFDLEWTQDKIATYSNDSLVLYSQKYKDVQEREYFITVDEKKITIGENNGKAKQKKRFVNG
jgi:hypothetical protein